MADHTYDIGILISGIDLFYEYGPSSVFFHEYSAIYLTLNLIAR